MHPGAVMIVPLLHDGRLVMERQWRYPLERVMLEFPVGKLEAGEPTLACAAAELLRGDRLRGRRVALAGVLHNAIAYSRRAHREIWIRARPHGRRAPPRRGASFSIWNWSTKPSSIASAPQAR